jgi:hypothetical protein
VSGAQDGGAPSPTDGASSASDVAPTSLVDVGPQPPSGEGGSAAGDGAPPGDAGVSPGWAIWPMPNAPGSGLPHPQSYDTSVAGVAIDQVTGLTWQRDATVLSTAQWTDAATLLGEAASGCAGLTLAGYTDWRVPSRIELVSLMNFLTNPSVDTLVFGAIPASYVSSSVHGLGTTDAVLGEVWSGNGTNTESGAVYYVNIAPQPLEDAGQLQGPVAVRCVRGQGSASGPHYGIASGTVHDNWTGLTWIQSASAQPMLPSTVGSYCAQQTLSDGGWRAPSVNELETVFGDMSSPDGVAMDSMAFPGGGGIGMGTCDSDVSLMTDGGPVQWISVDDGATGAQEDVVYTLPPLPGAAPETEYWTYALCVR